MRDRLKEFARNVLIRKSKSRISTLELNVAIPVDEDEAAVFIKDFLIKVEDIYNQFSLLDQKIKDVTDTHSALLQYNETDERLFAVYESIRKDFRKISNEINDLEQSLNAMNFDQSRIELRICNSQLYTLKRKLTGSVSDYYNIQDEYKAKCRARVKRQAQISGADTSKIDFDTALASKTSVFLQRIFPDYNVAHHYIKEMEKRHKDFLMLEKNIQELHDLMFDLSLIVKIDSSLINRIDQHSQVINRLVFEGGREILEYRQHKSTSKFVYYICFCCIIAVGIVILIIIVSLFA